MPNDSTDASSASSAGIWDPARIAGEISSGRIYRSVSVAERERIDAVADLQAAVVVALQHPKPLDIQLPVFNAVLAAQYLRLFDALDLPKPLHVYEPCVGASNPAIAAMEAYGQGAGSYTAVNLNQPLRSELQSKIAHMKSEIRIIADDARNALSRLTPGSFDVACFHHAVNDLLQTAVSEPRGMDTTAVDWFPNERRMIEWLAEDDRAGRLDSRGWPELLEVVSAAVRLVRPGGWLVFDHWNWCKFIGVDWFPWDLFYDMIPATRRRIAESGLPLVERRVEGVDPQWWMVLQVGEG